MDRNVFNRKCRKISCHRLTGLHFFKTDPYFDLVWIATAKYEKLIVELGGERVCTEVLKVQELQKCDETMLFAIVNESQIAMPSVEETFRPYHGVHLSMFPKGKKGPEPETSLFIRAYKRNQKYLNEMIFMQLKNSSIVRHGFLRLFEATNQNLLEAAQKAISAG